MFLNYSAINSNNLNDIYSPDNIRDYYNQHGVEVDNDFMKKYLGIDNTPEIKTEETNTPKRTVSDVIAGIGIPSQIVPEQITPTSNASTKQTVVQQNNTSTDKVKNSPAPKSKQDFLKIYGPLARKASQEKGISEDMILAQIALETGWGKHTPGNNIGGIKAGNNWKGKSNNLTTQEQGSSGLYTTTQKFRAYNTREEGFNDYVNFLAGNRRYSGIFGITNPYAAADVMGRSGYATDKNYTTKLKNTIKQIQDAKA